VYNRYILSKGTIDSSALLDRDVRDERKMKDRTVVSVDRPSATSAVKEEADGGARLLIDSRAQDSGLRLLNF
jgi:hypothetical protein